MQKPVKKIDVEFKFATSDAPYRILAALAGLYAHVEKMKRGTAEEKEVTTLISSLMDCLGTAYGWGETLRNDSKAYNDRCLSYAGSVCKRLEVCNRQVNFWTPIERVLRVIHRAEGAWTRSLKRLILGNDLDDAVLKMLRASVARRTQIEESLDAQKQNNLMMNKNFVLPTSLAG